MKLEMNITGPFNIYLFLSLLAAVDTFENESLFSQ